MAKATSLAAALLDTTLEKAHMEVPATRLLTVTERSPDINGRRNRRALESSRPESRRLASTRRSVRARSTTCLTVHTLESRKIYCPVFRVQEEQICRHEEGYQGRKRQADVQCNGDTHASGDNHYAVEAFVHAWSVTYHCRRIYGPSVDRKAGLGRDGFRGKSAP
jgi:hypothetical protein